MCYIMLMCPPSLSGLQQRHRETSPHCIPTTADGKKLFDDYVNKNTNNNNNINGVFFYKDLTIFTEDDTRHTFHTLIHLAVVIV